MKLLRFILTTLIALASFFSHGAEPDFLSVTKVKDNVYNLNLNVGVVVGDEFVVLIESGYGEYNQSSQKIFDAVKSITNKPIKYVINMHGHGDHNGGNVFFAERGATIITHMNAVYNADAEENYPKSNIIRFSDSFELDLGNEVIEIEHLIGHTYDDGIIYLKNNNLLYVGETYNPKYLAYLGMLGMDSFQDWGSKALAKMNQDTIVVPSHGQSMLNKKQFLDYQSNVKNWFKQVKSLYQQGKSLEKIAGDKTALSYVKKMSLDGNPKYYDGFYKIRLERLIRFSLNQPYQLSQQQLHEYVGIYHLNNKINIEVLIQSGRLMAKQKSSFISWLKPIGKDRFESMTRNGEIIIFKRDAKGNISSITANSIKETRYHEKLTGTWNKIN